MLIWQFDNNYKDTMSWFPPSHPWWPFHLPGKPQLLREHVLPSGPVANVAFLPWGDRAVVVGMRSGEVCIFNAKSTKPARRFSTDIYPATIRYTDFGIMIEGPKVSNTDGPWHQWLILSELGMPLANQVITERNPTRDEMIQLESLSPWRQKRQLKKLARCNTPIREGPVPYANTHPGFFTMAQLAKHYDKQHPTQLEQYLFFREADRAVLRRAECNAAGKLRLKTSSEHFDFRLGIDTTRSRVVIHSHRLKAEHSFLVAPGVDHYDISNEGRVLALCGNGHLYLYG